jgi:hypothetical protein
MKSKCSSFAVVCVALSTENLDEVQQFELKFVQGHTSETWTCTE